MAGAFSKTQLDKLGERLRDGSRKAEDIGALDEYRLSFRDAYDVVASAIEEFGWSATGRPAKTTTAIVEKLRRQDTRLTQIQDIAGLRFVVSDIAAQDRAVEPLHAKFTRAQVIDRRVKSSHGYRAVHVVVHIHDKPVEIQVRTRPQHLWAEISEKLADTTDQAVKYGGGPQATRDQLAVYSDAVQSIEDAEVELISSRARLAQMEREGEVIAATSPDYLRLRRLIEDLRELISERETSERKFKSQLISLLEEAYNQIGQK